ncbi:MAG: M23 family metallopeptidase [Bacteroidota bacterium]
MKHLSVLFFLLISLLGGLPQKKCPLNKGIITVNKLIPLLHSPRHRVQIKSCHHSDHKVYGTVRATVRKIIQRPTFYTIYLQGIDGMEYRMTNLKTVSVKVGEAIDAGEEIGTVDKSTVNSFLYFSVWKDGAEQDAWGFVDCNCER